MSAPIFLGGMISHISKQKTNNDNSEKRGLLMASGFITGEALMGILVAIPIFITANKNWWPTVNGLDWLGIIFFLIVIFLLYKSVTKK